MAAPNTQQSGRVVDNAAALPESVEADRRTGSAVSSPLNAVVKDAFIAIGTLWFFATLVAIGAYALGAQLVAAIAAVVVVAMMFAWLAGLSFLVAGWFTRRFDVIAALTGGKASTDTPGQG